MKKSGSNLDVFDDLEDEVYLIGNSLNPFLFIGDFYKLAISVCFFCAGTDELVNRAWL